MIDTRLNNQSQLAGFSKSDDLQFFLERVSGIQYQYLPELAPTKEMLGLYRKGHVEWAQYESEYLSLISRRGVHSLFVRAELANCCLLCSEHDPAFCHRRLAAEHLQKFFPETQIVHLGTST